MDRFRLLTASDIEVKVKQNLKEEGLIMLANKILKEKKDHKEEARKVSEKFILFPNIDKYFLTRHLMQM